MNFCFKNLFSLSKRSFNVSHDMSAIVSLTSVSLFSSVIKYRELCLYRTPYIPEFCLYRTNYSPREISEQMPLYIPASVYTGFCLYRTDILYEIASLYTGQLSNFKKLCEGKIYALNFSNAKGFCLRWIIRKILQDFLNFTTFSR